MIEETATSGFEITTQIPAMKVSNSHGIVRRSRDTDVSTSGTVKRRRVGSEDQVNVFHLQYRSRHDGDADVIFRENVVSTAVSCTSDHFNSSFTCSVNEDSISDLKADCLSETEIFLSGNDGSSRDTSKSSVVCLESEEFQSLCTTAAENEATSGSKPPLTVAETPSAAELEDFFAKAEMYEQKRFAEKYNYDIVKDVPMEGRYEWILLKP